MCALMRNFIAPSGMRLWITSWRLWSHCASCSLLTFITRVLRHSRGYQSLISPQLLNPYPCSQLPHVGNASVSLGDQGPMITYVHHVQMTSPITLQKQTIFMQQPTTCCMLAARCIQAIVSICVDPCLLPGAVITLKLNYCQCRDKLRTRLYQTFQTIVVL